MHFQSVAYMFLNSQGVHPTNPREVHDLCNGFNLPRADHPPPSTPMQTAKSATTAAVKEVYDKGASNPEQIILIEQLYTLVGLNESPVMKTINNMLNGLPLAKF